MSVGWNLDCWEQVCLRERFHSRAFSSLGIPSLLRYPVGIIWISALNCQRNLGVFQEGVSTCFLEGDFSYFVCACWLGSISNKDQSNKFLLSFFKSIFFLHAPGWNAGDDGPWIPLRCSLPVCVVWGGGAFCSSQAPPLLGSKWRPSWRRTKGRCRLPNRPRCHQPCGLVRPSSSDLCSLWRYWCFHVQP